MGIVRRELVPKRRRNAATVFLVMDEVFYETSYCVGVFSSIERARTCAKKRIGAPRMVVPPYTKIGEAKTETRPNYWANMDGCVEIISLSVDRER
jgi:hypothetical protein